MWVRNINVHHLVQAKGILVKDDQYWKEIRCNKLTWKKVDELLAYAMLDSLIVAYVQYMVMLTDLQEVLSQDLTSLCSRCTTVLLGWTIQKTMEESLIFLLD